MSVGRRIGLPEASSAAQSAIRSSSTSEPPTSWPAATRNVKAMPPPTTRVSTRSSSALSTPSLSATLAPPTTATNGRAGLPEQPAEGLDLPLEQEAGGTGEPARRADHRGVAAVGDPEGVVDVGVVAVDQLLDEGLGRSAPRRDRTGGSPCSSTWGASRDSSSRTGPRSHRVSGAPSGRPRWVQAVTLAPCRSGTRRWAGRPGSGSRRSPRRDRRRRAGAAR